MYENNYNHIMMKLISLMQIMPNRLELLIVSMPPNATYVDTSLGEYFQRLMYQKWEQHTFVLYIRHDDKLNIFNKSGYEGCDSKYSSGLRVKSVGLEPDMLHYSWGSAANGKLGISDNYYADFESDQLNNFFQADFSGDEINQLVIPDAKSLSQQEY